MYVVSRSSSLKRNVRYPQRCPDLRDPTASTKLFQSLLLYNLVGLKNPHIPSFHQPNELLPSTVCRTSNHALRLPSYSPALVQLERARPEVEGH